MSKVCCFTGNRPTKISWLKDPAHPSYSALKNILREKIKQKIEEGFDYFISGMALGSDIICAQIVLDLQKSFPHVQLECAIPCIGQEESWSPTHQQNYKQILLKSNVITYMYDHYTPSCMFERNLYMVENSDDVIAIWNGGPGGTQNTISYAKRLGIPVDIINPSTM